MEYSAEFYNEISCLISEIRQNRFPSQDTLQYQTSKTLLDNAVLINDPGARDQVVLKTAEMFWDTLSKNAETISRSAEALSRNAEALSRNAEALSREQFLGHLVRKPLKFVTRSDMTDFILDAKFSESASEAILSEYLSEHHRVTPNFSVSKSKTEETDQRHLSKFRREMMPEFVY